MLATRPPAPGQPTVHRSPVTLQDLLDDLLWPHLLRSWKLALAPGRVAWCFLLVLVLGGFVGLMRWRMGDAFDALCGRIRGDFHSIVTFISGPKEAAAAVCRLFIDTPLQLVRDHPLLILPAVPLVLLAWCVIGGAVCRSCACEVSLRAALPWRQAIGFGLRKAPALFAALAGPLVLVWLACLALRVLGLVFFTTKVMGLMGALLFIAPLLLCIVIAAALFAYVLAHPLLIPSVACEGTDSFDAVQRCYAYVFSRPGRLVGYIIVSLLAVVPAVAIVVSLVWTAVTIAVWTTGAPGVTADAAFSNAFTPGSEGHFTFSVRMVHLWVLVIAAVAAAYCLSLYFCAATSLYLVVRRLVDGQDIAELWVPPAAPPAVTLPVSSAPPAPTIPEKADYT
ncbi:MAG TPA: hypothetical protein VFF65_09875 [Phycisphaerales bacterium]|nr:hypothetical protein [Phycisphaerales bacterium]